LVRKRSIHQIASLCYCEQFISVCSLIATAAFRWLSRQFLTDCQRLQTQTPPRGDDLARRSHFLTLSTRRWLPTWWVQTPHQASRNRSNLPLVLRSWILNVPPAWKKYWSSLKKFTDVLGYELEQLPQLTTIYWLKRLKRTMSTLSSWDLIHLTLIRR